MLLDGNPKVYEVSEHKSTKVEVNILREGVKRGKGKIERDRGTRTTIGR